MLSPRCMYPDVNGMGIFTRKVSRKTIAVISPVRTNLCVCFIAGTSLFFEQVYHAGVGNERTSTFRPMLILLQGRAVIGIIRRSKGIACSFSKKNGESLDALRFIRRIMASESENKNGR